MYSDKIKILSELDTDYCTIVDAEQIVSEIVYCPYCTATHIKKHGIKIIKIRDIPSGLKPLTLKIKRFRFQCVSCKKTFFEPLDFIDERRIATSKCIKSILNASFRMSFVDVARIHGVDEKTVRNIFNEYIEKTKDKLDCELPRVMGIDEVYLGSEYRCTISNLQDNLLFDLLESRKKTRLNQFCKEHQDQLANVQIVCMDLWSSYKDMVKTHMPNAVIVADRFHVQRMATNAVEAARKSVYKGLTNYERKSLKDARKLLLMNFDRLDAKTMKKVFELTKEFPLLDKVWRAKERFNLMWDQETAKEAKEVYNEFLTSLDNETAAYYFDLTRAMQNWEPEIYNYFNYERISNAATETLNREIGRKYDVGYGYSFSSLRNKLLFNPQGLDYSAGYSVRDDKKIINKGHGMIMCQESDK
jgi:transposase